MGDEFFVDAGYGRIRPSTTEGDWFSVPRLDKQNGRYRGLIYSHGAGGFGFHLHSKPAGGVGQAQLGLALCSKFPAISADWGGDNWGNDLAVGLLEEGREQLIERGAANAPMLMVAGSMGNLSTLRFIQKHPEQVAGYIGIIPALDNDDIRANVPSARAGQDAAWGVTYPAPLPKPFTVNPSSNPIEFATELECPMLLLGSNNDTITRWEKIQEFADLAGGDVRVVDLGALGHSDAAITAAIPHIKRWISEFIPNIVG